MNDELKRLFDRMLSWNCSDEHFARLAVQAHNLGAKLGMTPTQLEEALAKHPPPHNWPRLR